MATIARDLHMAASIASFWGLSRSLTLLDDPTGLLETTDDLPALAARAVGLGMRVSLVTNGFTLTPERSDTLAAAGVGTVFLSIDAADAAAHEANRGLKGVIPRIRTANAQLKQRGLKTVASVTINHLIGDFRALARFLAELGFSTVTFSYPKRTLHSSSQVFSATSPQYPSGSLSERACWSA